MSQWRDDWGGSVNYGNKNEVLINVILDKSGSMYDDQIDTINSFNSFFNEFKTEDGIDYKATLTLFDTNVTTLFQNVPVKDIPKLDTTNYCPDGMTALYDAVGRTIKNVGEPAQDTRVFMLIITDGQENSSLEWSREGIKKLIEEKTELPNWTFTFLGTGIDAWAGGGSLGVGYGNIATWNGGNTVSGMACNLARSVKYYSGITLDSFVAEKSSYFKGATNLSNADTWQADTEDK